MADFLKAIGLALAGTAAGIGFMMAVAWAMLTLQAVFG